mgnify:CR=1 FL=1
MKDKDILKLLNLLLVVLILVLIILVTPIILAKFNNYNISDINDIANSCRDKSIEDAGSCTVKITSGFYKYNIENVGRDLTFSELKEEGGVCSSWSEYYTEIGKNLGYNAENVIIPISGNTYHEFSVWSNEEAYCVFDQTSINCTKLQ